MMDVTTVVLEHASLNALDVELVADALDVRQVVLAAVLITAEEHLAKGLVPKSAMLVAKEVAA